MNQVDIDNSWSINHERMWLASVLSEKTTAYDKSKYIHSYLTSLNARAVAFDGSGPMDLAEYDTMVSFCLNLLYNLERHQ